MTRPSVLLAVLRTTEPVRLYLYPMVAAVVALLAAYALLVGDAAVLWVALLAAVLGVIAAEVTRGAVYSPHSTAVHYEQAFTAGLESGAVRARDLAARLP